MNTKLITTTELNTDTKCSIRTEITHITLEESKAIKKLSVKNKPTMLTSNAVQRPNLVIMAGKAAFPGCATCFPVLPAFRTLPSLQCQSKSC